jgi:alkanesulfonate monooxygenase SsuD/methylene tetrahydromethanopterin reductase-like flavin-dependent oxidoreductase (luciferase family)
VSLEFGIFDWIDESRPLQLADQYEQRLRMLEYADTAGYWCYHLAEHHGSPLCMAPSPSLFLAAAAQRTRRIRLGPLVHLFPLYNPLRHIEEICMLDHLTRGRLEVGIGRGISPYELAMFNVDISESRAMFQEALEIVLMGLKTGSVNHEGRYYSFKDAIVPLRPFQRPYPPLWYPGTNPESLAWIGANGLSTLVGHVTPSLADTTRIISQYKETQRAHANDPDRLNAHVSDPKYGFCRHVYVAETDAQALREARAAWAMFHENFNYQWRLHGDTRWEHEADFDAFVERRLMFVGSPATVSAELREYADAIQGNYFAAIFAFGSLSGDQILSSMRLFTERVRPAFTASAAAAAI